MPTRPPRVCCAWSEVRERRRRTTNREKEQARYLRTELMNGLVK
jgi:hypothetical protein